MNRNLTIDYMCVSCGLPEAEVGESFTGKSCLRRFRTLGIWPAEPGDRKRNTWEVDSAPKAAEAEGGRPEGRADSSGGGRRKMDLFQTWTIGKLRECVLPR
ncbi:MAG: hypothetical protein ACLVLH_08585 [Eisenbergiella massiliensis]